MKRSVFGRGWRRGRDSVSSISASEMTNNQGRFVRAPMSTGNFGKLFGKIHPDLERALPVRPKLAPRRRGLIIPQPVTASIQSSQGKQRGHRACCTTPRPSVQAADKVLALRQELLVAHHLLHGLMQRAADIRQRASDAGRSQWRATRSEGAPSADISAPARRGSPARCAGHDRGHCP